MKIAYFDMIGGASGDMLLGSLLDAGLSFEVLQDELKALNLPGYSISWKKVNKLGFQATKFEVEITDQVTERHLEDILKLLQASSLPVAIREQAELIFMRIGEVEASIHNTPVNQVHLHELGGIDTLVDVAGVLLGLRALRIEAVYCSPFPLGRGFVSGAHGSIPLPSPATVSLLKGVPVVGSEIEKELVTPTGAVLLTSLARAYGAIPAMTLQSVGYGAGGRDLPIPNILRVLLGEVAQRFTNQVENLVQLETNIDDLNPQIYDHVLERLFTAGALDATLTPIHMKKNRPGVMVSVLCQPANAPELEAILFAETSTLGVRHTLVERRSLPRTFQKVHTPYGEVQIKVAEYSSGNFRCAPEYEDCRRLAVQAGVPLWQVFQAAMQSVNKVDLKK